jgi:hypothetical protein
MACRESPRAHKWMRWRTCQQLMDRSEDLIAEADAAFAR